MRVAGEKELGAQQALAERIPQILVLKVMLICERGGKQQIGISKKKSGAFSPRQDKMIRQRDPTNRRFLSLNSGS